MAESNAGQFLADAVVEISLTSCAIWKRVVPAAVSVVSVPESVRAAIAPPSPS